MRRALKTLLSTRPGYDVIGEAANKDELISQIESTHPDILLLDEDLSDEATTDLISTIQQYDFCPSVIVIGSRSESRMAYLDAGAEAFNDISDPPKSLLTAVEGVRLRRQRG